MALWNDPQSVVPGSLGHFETLLGWSVYEVKTVLLLTLFVPRLKNQQWVPQLVSVMCPKAPRIEGLVLSLVLLGGAGTVDLVIGGMFSEGIVGFHSLPLLVRM